MSAIRLIVRRDSDEVMIHWPSGDVEFMGLWATLKLLWWVALHRKRLIVVDGDSGEESEC